MKKFLLIILVGIFAITGISTAFATGGGPTCTYKSCPGGSDNCCTQNGVTLYINT